MYSIYIPLHENPSFEDVADEIKKTFEDFNLDAPKISKNDFDDIEVYGKLEEECCFFSSMFLEPSFSEFPDCSWMGDLKTRGSWLFAGIVAYAIAKRFAEVILNDSGAKIGTPGTYLVKDFYDVIKGELNI